MHTRQSSVILIPVKDPGTAKSRLSPLLTLSERRQLAWLMLEGVMRETARADSGWGRALVTSHQPAMELGESLGFRIIREARQVSESRSVDSASMLLEGEGVEGVLRIPLDLPLFSLSILHPLLERAEAAPGALLVPSRDGTGTNALYRSPPTGFPSRFGSGSRQLHQEEARLAGCELEVLSVEHLALDIDEPDDVAELVRRGQPCPALDFLRTLDIAGRLKGLEQGAD